MMMMRRRLKEALLTSADGEASPKLEEILSAELVARPKVNIVYISRGPSADG
jgi:hypothetical protein